MQTNHCPICQSPIPENAPGGLCPACVLRDADEAPASGPAAPSIVEITAAFPQLEVISLIGQGGMGFVYKARQPGLDRTIALKILAPALSHDPAFAERFAREARTLGKLQHPNIVTIFEHGESKGFFYLMMEYVDGVNLRQAMRAGRFSPEQALTIVPGICDALQTAHEQGVWHRDIKPENILLDREGRVKIADFGIARIIGDPQRDFTLTMTGNALGSAAYMAPEQHEKPHEVDHRADIYSLGVVIYEMLTGELPLGRFPAPSQRAAVDARIDEIVFKTLEKERELRQQSATEVKTDVFSAMQPGGSQKGPPAIPAASKASGMAKLGCGLLLGGVLALPFLPELGVIAIILAFVLGIITWREGLGKFVTIGAAVLMVLSVPAVLFMSLRGVKREAPKSTVTLMPTIAEPSDVEVTRVVQITPMNPKPAISVEETFRKAVTAANESDGEEFGKYMNPNGLINQVDGMIPVDPFADSDFASRLSVFECMKRFVGEIVTLKVTASPQDSSPMVYATMRGRDGSLYYTRMQFELREGEDQWRGMNLLGPEFRTAARIEFKPANGNAGSVLKTHLSNQQGKNEVDPFAAAADIEVANAVNKVAFSPVEGKPGIFDIYILSEHAYDEARIVVDGAVQALHESLKPFGMDSALKIISPATSSETPWMAEDAPSFEYPKP